MKNNLFKINNIVWDCTKKELKATGLPTSIPLFEVDSEDEICDRLSDKYGFCIMSLEYEPIEDEAAAELQMLNDVVPGWTESRPGGLVCNNSRQGGIIDCTIGTNNWFVIFNDGRPLRTDFPTRRDAIEAFVRIQRASTFVTSEVNVVV